MAGLKNIKVKTWGLGIDIQKYWAQKILISYFEDKLIEGKWTIKGYTSCSMWEDPTPIVSYSREMIYNQFYTMPKVNGADVMVGDANTNANPSAGGYSMLTNTWDETTGRYNFNSNTGWVMGYGRKATNDFIVDFDIDAIHRKDFRIYTSTDTPIIFRSHFGGVNGFFIGVKDTWFGAGKITGPANVYTAPHNDLVDMRLRVAMYDDVLYIFGNTYTNSAGVLAESDTWLLLATLSETNGIQCYNGMSYASEDGTNIHEGPFYKAVKDAATNDEYAFAVANHQYTAGTTVYMALEDDDQVVADFIKENTSVAVINNVSFTYSAETNTYSTTTAGAKMEMGSTTGDWMARVKLNSVAAASSNVELRIQISETKYIILRSGVDSIGQEGIFFRTPNCFPNAAGSTQDRWWSETFVGYNTSKFVNEDDCTAEGSDGYLDLMIVRSGGTIYFYGCEYLDAEGKAVDYASWQLIFAFNSEKNVEFGEGISFKDAGGNSPAVVNGNFTTPASEIAAATAHTFIMVQCAGIPEGNVVINDDDAAVATFMNGEKLLADYAKI